MESQNAMKCVNGCGFFGSPNYEGMCSKCFREKLKKQMSTTQSGTVPHTSENVENQLALLSVVDKVSQPTSVPKDLEVAETLSIDTSAPEKKRNRCLTCKKRVGLTGFPCRCGGLFCGLHRYSDMHACSYDYKEGAKEELRKNNPTIVSSKINKI